MLHGQCMGDKWERVIGVPIEFRSAVNCRGSCLWRLLVNWLTPGSENIMPNQLPMNAGGGGAISEISLSAVDPTLLLVEVEVESMNPMGCAHWNLEAQQVTAPPPGLPVKEGQRGNCTSTRKREHRRQEHKTDVICSCDQCE